MVLGTAQFGMDYGIANISGKPTKKDVFGIFNLAWEMGVRHFDTAPGYDSETLLGEFIAANNLQDEAIILTKIPPLENFNGHKQSIKTSLESSLNNLGCPVDVLFFHKPADSRLLLDDPQFFENLIRDYPLSTMGVSVYESQEVKTLSDCHFELAFQFPLNVLDRRFEQVSMPQGMRYARSIFLQGILASDNSLRLDTPKELLNLQKEYHDRLSNHNLEPVGFAVSFVANHDSVDYFLVGVDTEKQLQDILDLEPYEEKDMVVLDALLVNTDPKWIDPRNWS